MSGKSRLGALMVSAFLVISALPAVGATRAEIQRELNELSRQISIVDEEYNLARIELSGATSRIRSAERDKEAADAKRKDLRGLASKRAAAVYRTGAPDVLMVLLTSRDPRDFARRMGLISRVDDWESGILTSLEIASETASARAEELQKQRSKALTVKESIEAKKRQLEEAINKQKRLLAELAAAEEAAARAAAARRPTATRSTPTAKATQPPQALPDLPASPQAKIAVQTAYEQIGKPYKWGAAGPDSFDCSGLTMFSWRRAGVSLPHSSRSQYSATRRVAKEDLQPGDLVFFGSPIHHVGIYIGDNNMINAPETGQYVGIRSMLRRDYVGAGRPGI